MNCPGQAGPVSKVVKSSFGKKSEIDNDADRKGRFPKVSPWLFGVLLVLCVTMVYLPVWQAGFIWDDDQVLLENPFIRSPNGWYKLWFNTDFPLVLTSFWVEWRMWGAHPLGYHLTNLALHAMSAVLLWQVLVRLKIPGAGLAAALFAVHPVNVESVAWITERKNTLAMVFYALALLWYLRFEDAEKRRWYWQALAAFALALLSKTAVAPLPMVLLGLAWWRHGSLGPRDVWRSVPFFALAAGTALLSLWFQSHQAIGADAMMVRTDSFGARLAGAGCAVWFYLYKALLPVNLSFVYPHWHIEANQPLSYVPGILFAAVLMGCWHYRRQQWARSLFFGLGYFVLLLLPVLGFVSIYFMRYSLVADHWQYFAIIGPLALAGAGITRFFEKPDRMPPWIVSVVGGGLVLTFGLLAWKQAKIYSSLETLWRETLLQNPNASMAHCNLGNLLLQKGRNEEAISHFQKALAIQPGADDVLSNLGAALLAQGRAAEAISPLEEALRIKPGSVLALNNLANALLQQGKVAEALVHFQKAVELRPDAASIHGNFGSTLLQAGRTEEAIAHLRRSLELEPNSAEAHDSLGNALLRLGQTKEAATQFEQALKIRPDLILARLNLADLCVQQGRLEDAVPHFDKALAMAPGIAAAHNNLGSALLRLGRLEEAINHLEQALRIQPDLAEAHNNLANALFQKGRPAEAVAQYQSAVAARPGSAPLLNNLAWALATCPEASVRNGDKAVELALQADQLSGGKDPLILGTLAAAYAEAGRFPEAVATAKRALDSATTQANAAQVEMLRKRLALYQAGSPFRDQDLLRKK
jgi:tetratricopeptide (TPR) repeat protein